MNTSNVGLCEQKHRFVNPHLNDHSFQLQQPIVFIYRLRNSHMLLCIYSTKIPIISHFKF